MSNAEKWQEEIAKERINFILQQSLEGVINMVPVDTFLNKGVDLELREEEALSERFPAWLDTSGSKNRLIFEQTQFDHLIKKVSPIEGVDSNDIARLYIGCGLTMALFESAVSPGQHQKVDRLWTVLSSADQLTTEIIKADDFLDGDDKKLALFGVMESNENRTCMINALRFAAGLFFMAESARGNEGYGDQMVKSFRNTLKETLALRDRYIALTQAGGHSRETAEERFAEEISKMEFAISFPMDSSEVQTIVRICQTNEPLGVEPDQSFESTDLSPRNGFHIDRI